jgi:hypothetical protein
MIRKSHKLRNMFELCILNLILLSVAVQGCTNSLCATCNSAGSCLTCIGTSSAAQSRLPPSCNCGNYYYSAVSSGLNDCQPCARGCLTCTNSSVCTSCKTSTPARTGTLCTCPCGYYDNGVDASC